MISSLLLVAGAALLLAVCLRRSLRPRVLVTLAALPAALAIAMVLTPVLAQAQAVTPTTTGTVIDFGSTLNDIATVVFAILGTIGSWAMGLLVSKLKLDKSSTIAQTLDQVLVNAVHYGLAKTQAYATSGNASFTIANPAIAQAILFAQQHAPDAIKFFGLDQAALERMVLARLSKVLQGLPTEATLLDATPAAPAPAPAAAPAGPLLAAPAAAPAAA